MSPSDGGHVVVHGEPEFVVPVAAALRDVGETVTVLDAGAGARVEDPEQRWTRLLRGAGIESAKALILMGGDAENVHVALVATELAPQVRLVLRIFDDTLRDHLGRVFGGAHALSASALAAPALVRAALRHDGDAHITVAERRCVVSPPDRPGAAPRVRPAPDGKAPPAQRQPLAGLARLRALREVARSSGVRILVLASTVLVGVGTAVFWASLGLRPLDALYFTVTSVTTTGYGDFSLREAPDGVKVFGIVLLVLGAGAIAVLFALLTDALLRARISELAPPARLRGHVVVCGLGTVGVRVALRLHEQGVAVVGADRDAASPFVADARRRGIPVVIGDVRLEQTLLATRASTALSVVAATSDDAVNLAVALRARSLDPEQRVVLRLSEGDLARRAESAFRIQYSCSVLDLAAPAFALAALGADIEAVTLVAGVHVLVVSLPLTRPVEVGDDLLCIARGGELVWSPPVGAEGERGYAAGSFRDLAAVVRGFAATASGAGVGGASR